MGYSADKSPLIGHLAGPIRRLKPLGAQRQEKGGPNHLTREGLHATTPAGATGYRLRPGWRTCPVRLAMQHTRETARSPRQRPWRPPAHTRCRVPRPYAARNGCFVICSSPSNIANIQQLTGVDPGENGGGKNRPQSGGVKPPAGIVKLRLSLVRAGAWAAAIPGPRQARPVADGAATAKETPA